MGLEHRLNARKSIEVAVSFGHPALGTMSGRLIDVGDGGAAARVSGQLPVNAVVDLVLTASANSPALQLPALVVWSEQGRAGLMFCEYNQALRAQRVILSRAQEIGNERRSHASRETRVIA